MRRLLFIWAALLCGIVYVPQSEAFWQSRDSNFNNASFQTPCVPSSFTADFTTGSLPSGWSLANSSTNRTYINVSGVLTTASANAGRFNYDANYPAGNAVPSLTGPFLLYERAATNLFLQSNNYTTSWTINPGATATAASGTSPDGSNDAWSQVITASSFAAVGQSLVFSSATYSTSAWVKQNGANTGFSVGPISFGTSFTATAAFKRYVNTAAITAGTIDDVTVGATGAPAVGVLVFGSQAELGSVTSYIVTTTGTATRNADALTGPAIPSCVGHFTVTFDDNSTQSVTSAYPLTTTLNRPNIKTIVGAT